MLHIWVNSDMAVEAVRQSMHGLVAAPIGQDWFLSLHKVSNLLCICPLQYPGVIEAAEPVKSLDLTGVRQAPFIISTFPTARVHS